MHLLAEALEEEEYFETSLGNAIISLRNSDWDREFKSHGRSGYDFEFPINAEFVIVFKRVTDRNAQGEPQKVFFYLKTIERV